MRLRNSRAAQSRLSWRPSPVSALPKSVRNVSMSFDPSHTDSSNPALPSRRLSVAPMMDWTEEVKIS